MISLGKDTLSDRPKSGLSSSSFNNKYLDSRHTRERFGRLGLSKSDARTDKARAASNEFESELVTPSGPLAFLAKLVVLLWSRSWQDLSIGAVVCAAPILVFAFYALSSTLIDHQHRKIVDHAMSLIHKSETQYSSDLSTLASISRQVSSIKAGPHSEPLLNGLKRQAVDTEKSLKRRIELNPPPERLRLSNYASGWNAFQDEGNAYIDAVKEGTRSIQDLSDETSRAARLNATDSTLPTLESRISDLNLTGSLSDAGQSAVSSFTAAMRNKDWSTADKARETLLFLAKHGQATEGLLQRAKSIYYGAVGDATPKAAAALKQDYGQVVADSQTGDWPGIQSAEKHLSNQASLINASLTYRIVNEPGVHSAIYRYKVSNPRKKRYYLVAEALDGAGNIVPLEIRNEETGETSRVSRFGVHVSKATYDRFEQDKKRDRQFDHPVIGRKAPGHLLPSWSVSKTGGFLTSW